MVRRIQILIFLIGIGLLGGCAGPLQLREFNAQIAVYTPPDLSKPPQQCWTGKVSTPVRQVLWVSPKQLLVATFRGDLYLLDIQTGKRLSRYWIPYRRPVQILRWYTSACRLLVAGIRETKLFDYDLRRGKVAGSWRLSGMDGEIIAMQGYYYGVQNSRELLKIDTTTLSIVQRQTVPARCCAGVFLVGREQIALITDDGAYRWYSPDLVQLGQINLNLNPQPVYRWQHDTLVVADSKGQIVSLYHHEVIFTQNVSKPLYSPPLMHGSVLYCAAADGEVIAIDTKDGKWLWRYQGEGLINLPMAFIDGHLIVPFARGKIAIIARRTGELLYELDSKGPVKLVMVNDRYIVAFRRDKKVIAWHW